MKRRLLLLFAFLLLSGCSGIPLNLSSQPNKIEGKDYIVLGEGEGTSTGIMLFNIIPINQNSRFKNAYDEAVASKGGTRLINPVIEENWFWAYVLNGYKTKITGTVVKDL
jgi:hypothetical protein